MPVRALNNNSISKTSLGEHYLDFGNGERSKEGIVEEFLLVGGVVSSISINKGLGGLGRIRTHQVTDKN